MQAELVEAFNVTPPFRVEDFSYANNSLMKIMFRHLNEISFVGLTVGVQGFFSNNHNCCGKHWFYYLLTMLILMHIFVHYF